MVYNLFITGTDTGIGKTYYSARIADSYDKQGYKVAYYKPIQTGSNTDDDCAIVHEYNTNISCFETYNLELPASPLAAFNQATDIEFDINKIIDDYLYISESFDVVIIEGAGGIAVPISKFPVVKNEHNTDYNYNYHLDMGILAKLLDIPVLFISGDHLGTINHTILSIKYAKSLNLDIKGFLFNDKTKNINLQNTSIIADITKTKYITDYTKILKTE